MSGRATSESSDQSGTRVSGRESAANEDAVLAVENLAKTFGSGEDAVTAVDGVSFTVSRGEVVGLLGPNGAGKTTTIKSILGVVRPSAGSVSVGGVDPFADGTGVYTRVSAVLEGARNVYWRLTVRENVRYFAGIQGRRPDAIADEIDDLLELVGVTDKADETVRHLSRGMQQKVALACALVRRTPVVFLDEPTLGLDVEASRDLQREIRRLAEEEDRTIVVSSHDMDVIQSVCDRVIIVDDGRIVTDESVADLLDLFSTQTYVVELADRLESGALDRFDVAWRDDRPAFEAVLSGSEALYELMAALRSADAEVRDVSSVEPDLEEVFLQVVEDGPAPVGGDGPASVSGDGTSNDPSETDPRERDPETGADDPARSSDEAIREAAPETDGGEQR